MHSKAHETLLSELLEPTPLPFHLKRRHPMAFRYTPFSRKIMRRLDLYTLLVYELWVHLEWDKNITTLNERVIDMVIPCDGGETLHITPAMITVDEKKVASIHIMLTEKDTENEHSIFCVNEERVRNLVEFANHYGFTTITWNSEKLQLNPIELENWKQLLRYSCRPELVIPPALRDQIFAIIKQSRKTTIGALLDSIPNEDPEWVIRALSVIIQAELIFTDISHYPISYATELSAFHAFT